MFDAHIHLEQYDIHLLEREIETWRNGGLEGVIAVSNDLCSCYRTLDIQAKFPDFVHAAAGFHPEQPLPNQAEFLEWHNLIKAERAHVIAIGEVGLPHYTLDASDTAALDEYIDFLDRCLDVALEYDLPVALHAVHDKAPLVFQRLRHKGIIKAHFHWLKATHDVLRQIIQAGYYISVTPEVCYRVRDQILAKEIPLDSLLIETDGPWPYQQQFAGQQTTPLMLRPVIATLSAIMDVTGEQIRERTVTNTKSCYHIK